MAVQPLIETTIIITNKPRISKLLLQIQLRSSVRRACEPDYRQTMMNKGGCLNYDLERGQ